MPPLKEKMRNLQEIPSTYAGNYVAVVDENIAAVGKTQLEVYKKAKQLYPKKMVTLIYVPTKKETITFL